MKKLMVFFGKSVAFVAFAKLVVIVFLGALGACGERYDNVAENPPPTGCTTNVQCNDNDNDTRDWCDSESGVCHHTEMECNSNADCNDDNVCDGVETCIEGRCQAGVTLDCNDHVPYTVDSCEPTNGCVHTFPGCTSNAQCAVGEICADHVCRVVPQCMTNAQCDDGNICNGAETCNSAGKCQAGSVLNCDDNDPLTVDMCVVATGCHHSTVECNSNTDCDDGVVSNGAETCVDHECYPGTPTGCSGVNTDCDHDGRSPAQGDCDDDVDEGGAPASICHDATGTFVVINYAAASYAQRPVCPAGSATVNLTDGSFFNGPQISGHDTMGDTFDNDCDGKVDEAGENGLNNCSWGSLGGGTWKVICPWMN